MRRALFVLLLLSVGKITGDITDYAFGHPVVYWANGDPTTKLLINNLGWLALGFSQVGIVLAIWIAGRKGIWNRRSGQIRCVVYLLAFFVGGGRLWPAQYPDGSHRAFTDLFAFLVYVWLLVPTFAFLNGRLTENESTRKGPRTFSLTFLLWWMSLICVLMALTKFLTYWNEKLYDFQFVTPMSEVFVGTFVAIAPEFTLIIVSNMLMVVAWSGRWWMPFCALIAAIAIDVYGHQLIQWTVAYFENPQFIRSFGSHNMTDYAPTVLVGRNLIAWLSFGIARLLGVQFDTRLPIPTAKRFSSR